MIACGTGLVGKSVSPKATVIVGLVMPKKTAFELPPPGPGFKTVTEAVPSVAMSDALTAAVSCLPLTKFVVRGVPFHSTTAPGTKPTPFTVNVKLAPPGDVPAGTSGCSTTGTGLDPVRDESNALRELIWLVLPGPSGP